MMLPSKENKLYLGYKINNKTRLTPNHYLIGFRKFGMKFRAILPGFQHCGKYFTIKCPYLKASRNYSCTFSLSNTILPHLKNLFESFKLNKAYSTPYADIYNFHKDEIELNIKCLRFVSKFMCEMTFDSPTNYFGISGLYGPGISLTGQDSGTAVGIALGTGSLLFLDWASYLIRKIISIKSNGKYLMFGNEDFTIYDFPNVRLQLFVSYKTKEEVVGLEIFEMLQELCNMYNLDWFSMKLRISAEGTERWTQEFYRRNINVENTCKIYITTPPLQEFEVKQYLINIGISKQLIIIL